MLIFSYPHLPLKFFHPLLRSLEGVSVGNIVDDDGGLGAPVVHGGETVVPLLARSVPNLELDCSVVQADCLGQKCCADGRLQIN